MLRRLIVGSAIVVGGYACAFAALYAADFLSKHSIAELVGRK